MNLQELTDHLKAKLEDATYSRVPKESIGLVVEVFTQIYDYVELKTPEGSSWEDWTIGCETDIENKRWVLNNPKYWMSWDCEEESAASHIRWFIDRHLYTKGGKLTAPNDSTFIYCYFND